MNHREFFKPTRNHVIVFFILLIITMFIPKTTKICSMAPEGIVCSNTPAWGVGFPIFLGEKFSGDVGGIGVYPVNFAINLVEFYLLSCVIIGFYRKLKKQ